MLNNYYPLHFPYYQQGFDDDLYTAKWGMVIQLLDLNQEGLEPFSQKTFGIIGFKSDKGVYINNGRVGAVDGPNAIRNQMAKLPWHLGTNVSVFDVGNIDGPNRSLEELQDSLASVIERMRLLNMIPIVLGGGHETAYGHYKGLKAGLSESDSLGVVNFDAHFDLRPYDVTGPNSGTGFRQIYDDLMKENKVFHYLVLGLQEHNNNLFLFDFVSKSEGISFMTGLDLYLSSRDEINQKLDAFIENLSHLHVTIDMDCFSQAVAPGVSAVQSMGVDPYLAILILQRLAASGKILGFDLVEVSPTYDIDNHTANLAATFIFYMTQILAQR